MKEYKIDLHIHTNVNPHAFSTLEENIKAAAKKNMDIIAITNHGPALQDTPHWWHLVNIAILPDIIEGVRVIKSVEANILDENGTLDINQKIYEKMELVLAGFHTVDEYGDISNIEKNTTAILNLIKKQKADIIVHLGNPIFPVDYERIVKVAKENNVALEVNNTSLGTITRVGSKKNCKKMLELAKKERCYISLGTDAHYSGHIGEFQRAIELLEEVNYPEDLIINSSKETFEKFLKLRQELRSIDVNS
ncbi:phosphatase [Cetobacterium somerae]|uniref:phosphatase n=1 Tax=Cetobacterium sp. NK01 TaxID=2993530 RepID=UPI0021168299|nr:phosphatase [Cetobacterium sp. NK01]MCQ8212901.1 phosphatase [Cetobacterium sp. NK01]